MAESTSSAALIEHAREDRRHYHDHIHRLRGVAILGVVSMHVISAVGDPLSGAGSVAFFAVFGEGSPVFLMISGFLFRETIAKYRYPHFLNRKVKNVVVPYLVVSVPALTLYLLDLKRSHPWLSDGFFDQNPVIQAAVMLVTGAHLGPLWFIPMILLFFIATPAFVGLDRNPWLYWALPALVVLTVLVPRPEQNNNPLQSFVHFLSLFALGMLLSRQHRSLIMFSESRRAPVIAGLIAFTASLAVLGTYIISIDTLARAAFGLLAGFVLFVRPIIRFVGPALDRLGEASFPIFFLHGYPVAVMRAIALPEDPPMALWLLLWLSSVLIIAAGCAAFAFAARAVLGSRSRYVVGM